MTFVPVPPIIAPDPPPWPHPPQPAGEVDAWTLARRRANLDEGARPRLSRRSRFVATLLVILFTMGGCGAIAWFSVGQYLLLANNIMASSGGEITYVYISTSSSRARVDVVLARGVNDREAVDVTCRLVLPSLSRAGLRSASVIVYRYDMVFLGRGEDACPGYGSSS